MHKAANTSFWGETLCDKVFLQRTFCSRTVSLRVSDASMRNLRKFVAAAMRLFCQAFRQQEIKGSLMRSVRNFLHFLTKYSIQYALLEFLNSLWG
jgi:hypothetical protein